MKLHMQSLAGALVLALSTSAMAQDVTQKPVTGADRKKATKPAPTVAPETPAQTQTTTTQSTTSTTAVPDESGSPVAVQKSTDTTQTTTTEPAPPGAAAQTETKSTTTVAPDVTGAPAATTTTTTTTQPAKDASGAAVTAATAADVKAGVPVFDQKGGVVGKVESVSAKGAVVSTDKVKAEVPVSSFGKNDKGLMMSMTKAELEAASAKSVAPPKKKK
jgi:hypothetical protein